MDNNLRMDFCTSCRKETKFTLKKSTIRRTIKGKEYRFDITIATCDTCGEEMAIPGLIDKNIQEVDEQYRTCEGIVLIEDIEKLMKVYKIGKAPLSLALGFGEVTIARYLAGQVPAKEYSDIIKKALSSPTFMKKLLQKNKNKISDIAYKKALSVATKLESLFCISDKMLQCIAYLFKQMEEVTPLMLQKLLYFIQGESYALYKVPIFEEDCQAWVHGPVYPEVYNLFRDFRYSPIEDARFVLFEGAEKKLNEREIKCIDLIINTFGEYSGKTLEKITHEEKPWTLARKGYEEDAPSREIIKKENIERYYVEKHNMYDFSKVEGLNHYILDILSKN